MCKLKYFKCVDISYGVIFRITIKSFTFPFYKNLFRKKCVYFDLLLFLRKNFYQSKYSPGRPISLISFYYLMFYTQPQKSQYHEMINMYFLPTCLQLAGMPLLQVMGCGGPILAPSLLDQETDHVYPQFIFSMSKVVAQ